MGDFGLGPKGFKRKQYTDIITDMESRARQLFGEDVNLSERSPLGLFLRTIAWFTGVIWQLAEKVYNSGYIDTAEGNQLDNVVKYAIISRRAAESATGEITITGAESTVIPSGFLVATRDGVVFETTEQVQIGETGQTTTIIKAQTPGVEGNTPAGTITEIVTPIAGVDSVVNNKATAGGRAVETDEELRKRYYQSQSKVSVRAALLRLPGVRSANVIQNTSLETDADGRPGKSIECYVLGGQPGEIAQAILDNKAGGIEAHGQVTVVATDEAGNEYEIGYTPAQEVDVWVNITVSKDARYPIDGDKQVQTQVIRYIGGVDADDVLNLGLSMGDSVILSKLVAEIYRIPGINDVIVELSTNGDTFTSANIELQKFEVAVTSPDKVVVNSA